MGKISFSLGKIEFGTRWEFCPYRRIFGIKKGPEYLYQLLDVLPNQTTCEMKPLQAYKFTFNNDFMMNRELNFVVNRNISGHVLIYWWVTLLLRLSYRGLVVEMSFIHLFFFVQLALVSCWKIFSSLPAESYNYNTKSWRRSSITSLQKQRPDVFTKGAVLKNSESLYCEIFKNTYFEDQLQTAAFPF